MTVPAIPSPSEDPSDITPDPAIHDIPADDDGAFNLPADPLQVVNWGETLLNEVASSIIMAITGITIDGIMPFAALSSFGTAVLGGLTDIEDLISGVTGSGGTATGLATFLNDLSTGNVQGVIDALVNIFTGGTSTGNPLSALTTAFQGFLNDIVSGATGTTTTGATSSSILTALEGLFTTSSTASTTSNTVSSFITSLLSGLGLSTSLTSADPFITFLTDLSTGNIQGAIDALVNAFTGGTTTGNSLSTLTSTIQGFLNDLVDGFTGTTGTTGSTTSTVLTGAESLFTNVLDSLTNLINPSQIPLLPIAHIADTNAASQPVNLLVNGSFDTPISIQTGQTWVFDSAIDHTGTTGSGSAQVTGNGTLQTINSNLIDVTPGQEFTISGFIQWAEAVAVGTGPVFQLNIQPVNNGSVLGTTLVDQIASPASSSAFTELTGTYTVPSGVNQIAVQCAVTTAFTGGTANFDDLSAVKTGILSGGLVKGISSTVESDLQSVVDLINQASGNTQTGNALSTILNALTTQPFANVSGLLGPDNIGNALQAAVDSLFQGFTGLTTTGNSLGQLSNATNQTTSTANNAQTIGQNNSTTLVNRAVTKPPFSALDQTADAVFPFSQLSGSTLPTVPVTSSTSAIGFIGTPDAGVKESVNWIGSSTGTISELFINIYSMDTATGALSLVMASPNIAGDVSSSLTNNVFNLPTDNFLTTAQSDVFAVEMAITGSGTYSIAGISHAAPTNTNTFPSQLGASRSTTSSPTAPSTISTVTYAAAVPWFGLSGSAGMSQLGAQTQEFSTAGAFTYTIPTEFMATGNQIDIIALGGGGGGQAGFALDDGVGAGAGSFEATTITIGVDIPLSTTTISGVVGAGGSPGEAEDANGSAGSASTVTATGSFAGLSAAGGAGGSSVEGTDGGGSVTGASPGTETFGGNQFVGGAAQESASGAGNAPGGGGAGGLGDVDFVGLADPGGHGATGAVWFVAHQ
jgi:hypothetical protein